MPKLPHQTTLSPISASEAAPKEYAEATVSGTYSPEYLYATLSAQQTTNVNAGNHIEFDFSASRGNKITLSSGTGQVSGIFTLEGGTTYIVEAMVMALVNESAANIEWYDDDAASAIQDDFGNTVTFYVVDQGAHDWVDVFHHYILYTPSTDTNIKLEITVKGTLSQFYYDRCAVFIREFM